MKYWTMIMGTIWWLQFYGLTVSLQKEKSLTIVENVVKKEDYNESLEKTLKIDGNLRILKDNERKILDFWDNKSTKNSVRAESGSFRRLSGKPDNVGSSLGRLWMLAGWVTPSDALLLQH